MTASGTWKLTIKTPMGEQNPTLTLTETEGKLTGIMADPKAETIDIKAVSILGNKLTWKAEVKTPFPLTLTFNLTLEGDKLTGTCRPGMFPASPVTGVRS